MDEIVRRTNYYNPSEADEDRHRQTLCDERFEELNVQQIIRVLQVLAEKLKSDKWPPRNESGCLMYLMVIGCLRSSLSELDEKVVVETVAPYIFKACESCIIAGLPASLTEIISELLDLVPSEYYEHMTEKRLTTALNLLRVGHYRALPNDNEPDFAKEYCATYLRRHMIDSIEQETMMEHLQLIVDTVDFMIKAMLLGTADAQLYYDELITAIRHQCRDHPLQLLEPSKLAGYLLSYQDILDSREVFGKTVEEMMTGEFAIIYHLLRGDDSETVGPVIAPLALKLLARQAQRQKVLPWLKKSIKDLCSALYLNDDTARAIFQSVDFKETLATLSPILTTVNHDIPEWDERIEEILRHAICANVNSESDGVAFFEMIPDILVWKKAKVIYGVKRVVRENLEHMVGALKADPDKFVASVLKCSQDASKEFADLANEKDKEKKRARKETAEKLVDLVDALFEVAKIGMEPKLFLSAGPPFFACPLRSACSFIEHYIQSNEKKLRAALKENKAACLECLRQTASLVKTFKGDEDDSFEYRLARDISSSLKDFLKLAQSARAAQTPEVQQFFLSMIVDVINSANANQAEAMCRLPDLVKWDQVGALDDFFAALKFLTSPSCPVEQESTTWPAFVAELLDGLVEFVKPKPHLLHPFIPTLITIMDYCLDNDFYFDLSGSQMPTIHAFAMVKCTQIVQGEFSDGPLTEAIYPRLLKYCELCPPEFQFYEMFMVFRCGPVFSGAAAVAAAPYLGELIDLAEGSTDKMLLLQLSSFLRNVATAAPEAAAVHTDRVVALLARVGPDISNANFSLLVVQALCAIVKAKPQIINAAVCSAAVPMAKIENVCFFTIDLLDVVAQNRPSLLRPHMKDLTEAALVAPNFAPRIFDLFEYIGSEEKSQVEPVMAALEAAVSKLIRTNAQQTVQALVVMRRLALITPAPLARREKAVKAWSQEPALHDYAQHLLDVIADRTLAGLDANIAETSAVVAGVSTRLEETEERVDVIDYEVHQHSAKIENLEERADETEERLDAVEQDVEEMGTEIEAIDQKTMTNAPKWSRKVSLLLNEEGDHDWRLLAQRLGYGAEDIRGWASQHDPCMSVLSEWYASRRAAGATHAVRQALREMDRLDALAIVEEAIDAAAGTVPDEPQEYATPPPVFLSYQWGHQPEAKLLCRHLEMAGYHCWMDIGQMGGGDKLFEAIDRGLRGAEVMIACVTDKYAASENCRRELNLAASVGKPIIPLQMHRMAWPPAGPMGPLLAEYLFIRVFSRSPPPSGAPFWPDERFRELLMQIRLHVAPDFEEVRPPYERWWEPPEEMIVVPQRDQAGQAAGGKKEEEKEKKEEAKEPDVFISYQWGRQPQVKKLYSRLTGLGCHCWMDIAQMGGGDSLYDKIDRGIRACKVVIACVTPKYALSANCRKEVSLAHAVGKPIVPLLLDKCDWPPAGPMSMVFTELLYIGLHKDQEEQETWDGPKTEELLTKLRQYNVLPPLPAGKRPPSAKPEEKRPPSAKPDVKRPPSAKPEEKRPPSAKPEEKRPPSAKPEEKRPPSAKPEEKRPPSAKPEEKRPPSAKPEEKRPQSGVKSEANSRPTSAAKAPALPPVTSQRPRSPVMAARRVTGAAGPTATGNRPKSSLTSPRPTTAKSPEPPAAAPAAKAPETPKPEAKAPETPKPEAKAPETPKPEAKAPETQKPEAKAPGTPKPAPKSNGAAAAPEPNQSRSCSIL